MGHPKRKQNACKKMTLATMVKHAVPPAVGDVNHITGMLHAAQRAAGAERRVHGGGYVHGSRHPRVGHLATGRKVTSLQAALL